ncbi:unnamed protein product [marine sediment metagenome]|uniref:Uncharacterized protein n=1 Tax=marine sediment metagenome TaxID=412755 RepID=X1GJC9_9ZZZZ
MVEEEQQKIKQVTLKNEDLNLSPEYIRESYTTNFFRRTFALLQGWTGDRAKFLRCTVGGVLKTAPVATGLEEYKSATSTLADNDFHEIIRDDVTGYSRWDFLIETHDVIVSLRNPTNTDWSDEIALTTGWHSIDLVSNGVQIKNRVAASNAKYQIVGYR